MATPITTTEISRKYFPNLFNEIVIFFIIVYFLSYKSFDYYFAKVMIFNNYSYMKTKKENATERKNLVAQAIGEIEGFEALSHRLCFARNENLSVIGCPT